jgi:hypothetical protein
MQESPSSPVVDAVHQTWNVVAESLGTTATAALMRRAAKRAARSVPTLEAFRVEGTGYTYRFELPSHWQSADAASSHAVRALLGELCGLLGDLTGTVVTNRLACVAAIRPFLPAAVVLGTNGDANT